MIKKTKVPIVVGGTGGHVLPGCNLAEHLKKDYDVKVVTDKRGQQFIKQFKDLDILTLPSSPIIKSNIFTILYSFLFIFFSILRSLIFLTFNRPSVIFGMGGYASFPICVAGGILRIKFVIYENNLIIGKTNKYLLPITRKVLVSFKELEGIPKKFNGKIIEIGNIIKKEIINIPKKKTNIPFQKINLLILGGSQAAKTFAQILPNIFSECVNQGIDLRIYQQCLPNQNEELKQFYQKKDIEFQIFNFSENIIDYFLKANLAITRSGSSILAELTNANIPFISVPLPSSADNHQLKNANYYKRKKLAFLIEEVDLKNNLLHLIKEIYKNNLILDEIIKNQSQYSDKNVYNNIDKILKELRYK